MLAISDNRFLNERNQNMTSTGLLIDTSFSWMNNPQTIEHSSSWSITCVKVSINEYYYHLAFSILKYCKLKQSVVERQRILKRVVQVTVLTQEKIWRPQDHGSLSCDILFFSFRGSCSFTIFYHVFCNAYKDML